MKASIILLMFLTGCANMMHPFKDSNTFDRELAYCREKGGSKTPASEFKQGSCCVGWHDGGFISLFDSKETERCMRDLGWRYPKW